jgi:alkaline phosphatase D
MSALRAFVCFLSVALAAAASAQPGKLIHADDTPNTPEQQAKHYVVLVSLDGFRFDYVDEHGAPHLKALAAAGATAPTGMVPSYPSVTFPNHLSLVTGLYPEHHGIVANGFYDPATGKTYTMSNPKAVTDGSFYSGTPLWSLAEAQGMRTAEFFWPGSEARIAGYRPDDYLIFDGSYPDMKRIDQVIDWLREPEARRPHFITLYYSDTDHAGHMSGPDSGEVKSAVHHVDELMGKLRERLDATGLPVDLIVLADHGMAATKGDWINLEQFADLSHFKTEGSLLYPQTEADAAKAYEQFRAHPDPRFTVYRRAEVPAYLHYDENLREGDPVIVPNGPFMIRAHAFGNNGAGRMPLGAHGYDPARMPEMKALFVANGPDIAPGTKLKRFPNVDVYDFICALLGLTPAANDGKLAPLLPALLKH